MIRPTREFKRTGATSGTGLTDIGAEVIVGIENGGTLLAFEILNGATTLTDFALLGKAHSGGEFVTLLNSTGWDTVAGILKHKVGTLKTLANAARGMAYVDIGPLYSIKFQASVAASTTTPLIKGGFV